MGAAPEVDIGSAGGVWAWASADENRKAANRVALRVKRGVSFRICMGGVRAVG
jgi:hypothetical protein